MNVNAEIEVSNGQQDWTRKYERLVYSEITEDQFFQLLEQAKKLWPVVEAWRYEYVS